MKLTPLPLKLSLGSFAVCCAVLLTVASAQPSTRFASGILSVPVSDYADEEDGAAELGGGASVGFFVPVQHSLTLSTVLEGYVIYHRMNSDYFEEVLPEAGMKLGGWTHMGALAGLRFSDQVPGVPQAGLYAQIQGGLNYAMLGDITIQMNNVTVDQSTKPMFSPAFALEAGLREGRYGLAVRYLNLGEPKLRVTARNRNTGETRNSTGRLEISMINLVASFYF